MNKNIFIIFVVVAVLFSFINSQDEPIEFKMKKQSSPHIENTNLAIKFQTMEILDDYYLENETLLELVRMKDGLYSINLELGTPPQKFEVIVDSGSFLLWITSNECKNCYSIKNNFIQKNSTTFINVGETLHLKYISGEISGNISLDQINFGGAIQMQNFKFLLSNNMNAPVNVDGIIGLARNYQVYDNSYSIVDSLFNSGKIKKRMFSQLIEEDESQSKFTIGSLPKEIHNNMPFYTTCNTIQNNKKINSYWACNLKKVLFKTKEKQENSESKVKALEVSSKERPAIFDTGSNVVIAPLEFADKFRNIYFKELIENKSCQIINDYTESYAIRCNLDVIFDDFPDIIFVFDNDFTYNLKIADLFIRSYSSFIFRIVFQAVPGDGWLLGQPFLKQYHIVFDQDENQIGLFPKIKQNIIQNKIIHLDEFEISLDNEPSLNLKLYIYYVGLYYLFGISIAILALFTVKITKNLATQKRDEENAKKLIDICYKNTI